jgi:peptidoglycan/xylan/chitin deacetylase (PgdA/CDA1 family)
VLSVDLDEWFHSRRWTEGVQTRTVPDTQALFRKLYGTDVPPGDLIAPVRSLLALFARHKVTCTFFVLGEVAEWYPALVRDIAEHGHEIGCHGLHHVDMTVLGPEVFASQLAQAVDVLTTTSGQRPVGYRAPNLVYEPWATGARAAGLHLRRRSACPGRLGEVRNWAMRRIIPIIPATTTSAGPATRGWSNCRCRRFP